MNQTTAGKVTGAGVIGMLLEYWIEYMWPDFGASLPDGLITAAFMTLVAWIVPASARLSDVAPGLVICLLVGLSGCVTMERTYTEFGAGCTAAALDAGECVVLTQQKENRDCQVMYCPDPDVAQLREVGGLYSAVGLGPLALTFSAGSGSDSAIPKDADVDLTTGGELSTDPATGEKVLTAYQRRVTFGTYERTDE